MGVSEDLDSWWAEKQSYDESNTAKAEFQDTMTDIDRHLDVLEASYNAGDYDKLPQSVKTKFIWAWGQLNTARNTIKADADFMAAISWKP